MHEEMVVKTRKVSVISLNRTKSKSRIRQKSMEKIT